MTNRPGRSVRLGYLRLTDSAPCLVARELGFFSQQGLRVQLSQEVSWANVRDKLAVGELQAAPLLVPLPAMVRLGASGVRAPLMSGLILSANGNAITLGRPLAETLNQAGPMSNATEIARRLAGHLGRDSTRRLTFAVVHHFSTHMVLLRRWLRSGGIDPDRDVRLLVIPPSQMVDSLASGVIDGFCAGEPWNSLAAQQQDGQIAAYGQEIWPDAPEKALCVDERWHKGNEELHLSLRLALMKACRWLDDPGNRAEAVALLARADALNLPVSALAPALQGPPLQGRAQTQGLYQFDREGRAEPWLQGAHALVQASAELLGKPPEAAQLQAVLSATYRADLYQAASALLSPAEP